MVGLVGASALLRLAPTAEPGADPQWFPGDPSVRQNFSPGAVELSNVTVALTMTAPVFAELGRGIDYRLLNAGVVYGETLSANLALASLVKVLVARPRPYTYGPRANDASFDAAERHLSFYSGHTSSAFASAVAGSYLFAEGAQDEGSRIAFWATELTLAAATANLRVRAGKHYYSDVVVGALVGVGLGIGVPLLHGADYAPRAGEYIAAGSGFVAGVVISQLLPLQNLADARRAAALLRGLRVDVGSHGTATLSLAGAF